MTTQNLKWKRLGAGSLFGLIRQLQDHGGLGSTDGRYIIYTFSAPFESSVTKLYERVGHEATEYRVVDRYEFVADAKAAAERLYAEVLAGYEAQKAKAIAEAQAKGERVHILDEFESAPIPGSVPVESPAHARLHAQAQSDMMQVVQDWQRSAYHADLALKAAVAARRSPDFEFAFMRGNDARYEATLAARYALRAMDFPFTPVEGASGFHHHEV